jgi:transcriptional regulator with XRE-family HTH domain
MTKTKPFSALAEKAKADPERRARIEAYRHAIRDAMALADLRADRKMTQQEVAEALRVSQPNVSRIEHEEDLYISTLRGYVIALGGKLEINAVFPDQTVALVATEDEER